MNRRDFISIAAAAVTGSAVGYTARGNEDKKLELFDHEMVRHPISLTSPPDESAAGMGTIVRGELQNISDSSIDAEIRVEFFRDRVLQATRLDTQDLDSGEVWEFDVRYPDVGEPAEMDDYRISVSPRQSQF